jgi:hypothetical protein
MKTPLLSQSSSGAAVSIWVEVRNVYSLGSTLSPRPSRARTSGAPWRTLTRLDVEESAAIGLQRVADVPVGGSVGEERLPVGARAREQRSIELRTSECPAGKGHDPPMSLGCVTEIERFAEGRFQPVDPGQARVGQVIAHRHLPSVRAGSLGWGPRGVTVVFIHS